MNPWSLARARVRRIPAFLSCCFKYNISNYTTLFPDCQSLYSIFIVAIFIVYSAQRALKLEHSVPCASVVSPPVMPICSASQKRSLLYNAVHGLTLYFQSVLRGFEHIAEHAALVFIIAAAACVTLSLWQSVPLRQSHFYSSSFLSYEGTLLHYNPISSWLIPPVS